MDQYHHLTESLDYSGNMLSSAHHLMNQQHQLQATHQANQQPQYTQLHAAAQHRNLNNMSNLNSGNVPLMNGQKSNGTSNGQVNSGNANLNGNHNGNHNANHGTGHNGNAHSTSHNGNHNSGHSINGNGNSNANHGVNGGTGGGAGVIVHHNQNAQQQHLNQQLMQLNAAAASSPPQHQSPALQHAQMSHDQHLHSLETRHDSPQLTNLTNSNGNGQQQPEQKYTPPNQSMKRKLDDYLEPQMNNDGLLNEDESPMKKMAQANGKKTKGRVKIKMEFIDNKLRRYTTFSKRKTGIMKKAYELSTLTGTQVMLLVASETGHVYTFATRKLQPMITSEAGKALIQTCLNSPDAPHNALDQRMSATGFEETDLNYSIHDDSSEKDEDSSSSETFLHMPNDELAFKLGDIRNKFVDDDEKEEKFVTSESSRLQSTSAEIASGSGRQQLRKSKKPTKTALNLQLDSLSAKAKAGRSQLTDHISQFNYHSPQSSSSSPSNSPTSSPSAHLFTNNSLNNLASLTNPVNSSPLNSTNRATQSDHLNASQSLLPITFVQKNQVLQGSTASSLPSLNQNLISPAVNKSFNFKSNKPQQSPQTQLSTLISSGNHLLFYQPGANTLMYQPTPGVVCGNNSSSVFNDNLTLNSATSTNSFDNSQFRPQSAASSFGSSSSLQQFKMNERKV